MYREGFFTNEEKPGIVAGFKEWLQLQNYAKGTIKYGPRHVEIFIEWCNKNKIKKHHVDEFFQYLKRKKSEQRPGALALGTLKVYLRHLRLFKRFLQEVGHRDLRINIIFKGCEVEHHQILTLLEIERLYEVTDDGIMGMRDRAMLGVYYGCGLRRSEGADLKVGDILPDKNLLFVSKGKNYKQRYVPMIGKSKQHILEYLTIGRPALMLNEYGDYFFISQLGTKLTGKGMYSRFKKLIIKAGIEKQCGLHSLRHSIATHLLSNGMGLRQIARFLGHETLDTTQIYTHILRSTDEKSEEI